MIVKWNNRTVAAVGGMTATVALMAALTPVRADELSDLRANQKILEQRIDQLAAANAAGGSGLALAKGSFPRSILIPGTDTSIRIGGHVELDMDWSLSGGTPSNGTNGIANNTIGENGILLGTPLDITDKTLPDGTPIASTSFGKGQLIDHARSHGGTQWTPRQSRIRIETRTPTAWGQAGTVMEFDFAGGTSATQHVPNSIQPRLRLAYGTLGPWLVGQAYDNFSDNESHATTLDFGGNVGHAGLVRPPQVRYTFKFGNGADLAVAAASPDTCVMGPSWHLCKDDSGTIAGPGGASVNPAKNGSIPDFSANLTWHQPWGHISLRGVVRDLHFSDGRYISKEMAGGAGAISGAVKPGWFGWRRDVITWGFGYGDGVGREFNGGDNYGVQTNYAGGYASQAAFDAAHVKVNTVESWAGHAGYTHWWTDNLESNADFGIHHQDFNSSLIFTPTGGSALTANKELVTTHLNLMYFPVSFVMTGVEWVWGHRVTTANLKGDVNEVIGAVRVSF